mmetsp:Transcript_32269/g.80929  ORF Transcript_32269/g.80929 Transcript_32269/m.80929 type:complete len:232 (+) Transcript_32269:1461-2156(+)
MGVTVGGQGLKDTVVNGQDRHIEGTATKIIHEDVLLTLLVKTISDGGGRGLVDDAHDSQTGDSTGILGGLTLAIVEVGGHSHNCVGNLLTEVSLSDFLHPCEHHGRDLLGGVGLLLIPVLNGDHGLVVLVGHLVGVVLDVALHLLVVKLATDDALGIVDGVLGVEGRLVLRSVTDEFLGLGEGHVRGRDAVSKVVGDDFHTALLEHTHTGVGGTKIDTDDGANVILFLLSL